MNNIIINPNLYNIKQEKQQILLQQLKIQIIADNQNMSNKQVNNPLIPAPITTLYLKQFFNNYTLRQEHADNVNILTSSLEVLSELIDQFCLKHSIQIEKPSSFGYCHNISNQYSKDTNLVTTFQQIYKKISKILQHVQPYLYQQVQPPSSDSRSASSRSNLWSQSQTDQQLYQILNEYKTNNKKLKQNVASLTKKLQEKCGEFLEVKLAKEALQGEICYLKGEIGDIQGDLVRCQHQLQAKQIEVQQKCKQIGHLQAKIAEKQSQVSFTTNQTQNTKSHLAQLQQKCQKLQKQKSVLQKKLYQYKNQQSILIKKKLQEIPNLVQQKLKDKKLWNKSAVDCLEKYIKCRETAKSKENLDGVNISKPK